MGNLGTYMAIQLLNIIFSLSGVMVKIASLSVENNGLLSIPTFLRMIGYILLLLVYAYFWQKIIKRAALSSAYLLSSMSIFWSMVWAFVIFQEHITVFNLAGVGIIFVGTLLVNAHD